MTEKEELLKKDYSILSNDELLVRLYFESSDYNEEEIEIFKSILDERGLNNPSDELLQQVNKKYQSQLQQSKTEIENKPLTKRQKVLFTLFPAMGFYYSIFIPVEWKKRHRELFIFEQIGILSWLGFFLLILLFLKLKGL